MKNIFVCLLWGVMLAPRPVTANHLLGGHMSYYFAADGQLNVELVIYRDCFGSSTPFDNPLEIAIYKPSGELFSAISLQVFDKIQVAIDSNACTNQSTSCIERATYTFPVSLPDDGITYHVIYQRCCRGADISNLANPSDLGFTLDVEITGLARMLKVDSPRWSTDPIFTACIHQPFLIDLAASGPLAAGDALVYSFCTPLIGGGNGPDIYGCEGAKPTPPCPPPFDAVPFNVPLYNFNAPLGSAVSSLNTINGTWDLTPDHIGKFTYAICVQKYRNSELLSSVRRDLTLWVQDLVGTLEATDLVALNSWPNPSRDAVTLNTAIFEGETIQIELSDLSGKIWLSEKRSNATAKEQVNLAALPQGVYFARVLTESRAATGRLVHF